MYVVEHDGHAVAGSLCQTDIARDHCFKDLCAEEAAQIGGNLLGKRGAVVVHRQQDAFDREGRINRSAKAHQSVEELGDAFQRQELALNGYEDGVGGGQGVDSQKIKRWGAIDEDVVVLGENAGDGALEAIFPIFHRHQLDLCADEVFVGRYEVKAFYLGIEDYALYRLAED
jgi:hypothetical protein